MFSTLRGNNGSFANFASVHVQPLPVTNIVHQVLQQTLVAPHLAATVVPVRQATFTLPVFNHALETITPVRTPTLSHIIEQVSFNRNFVIPIHTFFNNIVPTHALTMDAGRTYDPRRSQGFVNTTTKFQPYEQLTGISHERPEIIMLTNFQPLFNRDVSHTAPHFIGAFEEAGHYQFMTDAGRYMDAQFHMRSLHVHNVHSHLKMIRTRFPLIHQTFQNRTDDFTKAVNKLKEDASFLLNVVRLIESQKHQLDLRHDLHEVDAHPVILELHKNYNRFPWGYALHLIKPENLKPYTLVDCLTSLGYSPDSVKNIFASSKIWLQICSELKRILKNHSLHFIDVDPSYQRRDNNASTILQDPYRVFEIADNLPVLPPLDELKSLQVGNVSKAIGLLQPAFTSVYQQVFFKNDEARIAALSNLLSKEYRYSRALGESQVRDRLKNFYGYDVSDTGNTTMFDSVLGRFGNNITDFPAENNVTLASVAQQRTGQTGILTFETKYVEGDTGTLSPGGDFFFDRLLQTNAARFDVGAIDQLSKTLEDHADNFSALTTAFNFHAAPVRTAYNRPFYGGVDETAHFLESSTDTILEVARQLINPSNGAALPVAVNDRLGAVYTQAHRDNRIKSILFLYTLSRISRSYTQNVPFFQSELHGDNTPLTDALVDQLAIALENTTLESRTTIQLITQRGLDRGLNTSSLTVDSIRHAMKSGTSLTSIIERFMSGVLAQFRGKSGAVVNNYTRYGGYLDTVLMMVAFDFAISMVARYSNQSLVGVHRGLTQFASGQTTFAVSQTSTTHLQSFLELQQRVSSEEKLVQQTVLAVINSLQKLGRSLKGVSNYLTSGEAVSKLAEIASVVKNDSTMMRFLMSEQQIMLLASTAESLVEAHQNHTNAGSGVTHHSYHEDGKPADREIAILDESEVPPAMHHALMGYFGTGDFAAQHGINKRILTVGVPLGFSQHLKQKISIRQQKRATFENKRNDIIQVTVYKVDMQNADIVYKPVKFLFELSRFPTRFATHRWLPLPQNPGIQDIINAIPTQCYTQNPDSGTANSISSGIEYASTAIADSEGVKGARAAFDDESYSFLSAGQKAEILHNHVVSQLLEAYIKLMTGINVGEYNYHLAEPPARIDNDLARTLVDHSVAHIADHVASINQSAIEHHAKPPTGGVLFTRTAHQALTAVRGTNAAFGLAHPALSNPAGIAGNVQPHTEFASLQPASPVVKSLEQSRVFDPADRQLDRMSARHVPLVVNTLRTISSFSNTLSSVSNIDALNHHVISPKQFDRVFNIVVDARDFEIDVQKTLETPHGRQALELMLRHGDIVPSDANQIPSPAYRYLTQTFERALETHNRFLPNINAMRFRDRDKTQGDLIADKYFVTIETFGEDEV